MKISLKNCGVAYIFLIFHNINWDNALISNKYYCIMIFLKVGNKLMCALAQQLVGLVNYLVINL